MRPVGFDASPTAMPAAVPPITQADLPLEQPSVASSRLIRQHGISLVEVLVSLLVFSLGLLGLAALLSNSLKSTYSAYLRTQASQFAYDILDRMRANREAARAEAYDLTLTAPAPVCSTTASLADCDRAEWRADLANLPNGTGAIDYNPATEQVTVTIRWNDERAGGSTTTTFILQSQL